MRLILNFLTSIYLLYGNSFVPGNARANSLPVKSTLTGTSLLAQRSVDADFISRDENTRTLERLVIPWLMHYTNRYREEQGLDTLAFTDCLVKSAGYHTEYLLNESNERGSFKLGHEENPGSKWFRGKTPTERATAAGCEKSCGENALYFTQPSVLNGNSPLTSDLNEAAKKIAWKMVYEHWHNSKAHRDNMLNKVYTQLGAAVSIGKNAVQNGNATTNMVIFGVQVFAF